MSQGLIPHTTGIVSEGVAPSTHCPLLLATGMHLGTGGFSVGLGFGAGLLFLATGWVVGYCGASPFLLCLIYVAMVLICRTPLGELPVNRKTLHARLVVACCVSCVV